MRRTLSLVPYALAASIAFLALEPAPANASRSDPHFLFVAAHHNVYRFPMVDGLPSSTMPDRVYEGVIPPIAVSGEGFLYATKRPAKEYSIQHVLEFPPDSTQASRDLPMPYTCCDGTAAVALAVHPDGDLFASYEYELNGRARRSAGARVQPRHGVPENGVAIYAKGQPSGSAPVATFALPHGGSPGGLVFGPHGRLYAVMNSIRDKQFLDIAAVDAGVPHLLFDELFAEHHFATGIALDESGDIFAFAPGGFGQNAFVVAFTPYGTQPIRIDHILELPINEAACCGIDVTGAHLFVEDPFQVLVFTTTARRFAQPIYFFTMNGAEDLALGG